MSRKNKRTQRSNASTQTDQPKVARLPRASSKLIATAQNDITVPFYSDVLVPQDPTIDAKGRGKGLKLYDEVMQDGRARTTINKRISKVTRREWNVEPASENAKDLEIAQSVTGILKDLPFDRICKRLLKAVLKGFAVAEIVWGRKDGLIVPIEIKDVDPSRFVFDRDWNPRLLTLTSGFEGEALPPRKFIVHRFDEAGNNPYGHGLGSVLFWHVLFKREGVSFWMKFMDKFASPIPFGRYAHGTSKPEQDKLLGVLKQMVSQGALVAPIGTEVEFLEATRAGEAGYEAWVRYWDEQTSEVVLGSTLATGVKGQGSRAASQTHADETDALVDDDADALSETLNATLLRWIVELNWPGQNAPQVWRPRPKNEQLDEEHKSKRHDRQKKGLEVLGCMRREGFEPEDVTDWLSDLAGVNVKPVQINAPLDKGPSDTQDFAEGDLHPVGELTRQLEELAGPEVHDWIDKIRETVSAAGTYQEASDALLEAYPLFSADPLGSLIGDGLAVAEAMGRLEVIDETGVVNISKERGSKKN
ncbi:DUF935 domain-containing protein [Pseudovibrio exalbescens]|uniref:DUF935 domain-containing protein n=1 Tax=Pseudovibrio exalbescens TaxID=197461 RepID=UPI000C9BF44B|nr:DUF935 family protein [Pseudovibrio exalbescens]